MPRPCIELAGDTVKDAHTAAPECKSFTNPAAVR